VRYEGPYPYVDGLILQATRHVGEAVVGHRPRTTGRSGYTLRKLARLASNMALGFSVVPLRIATVLGLAMGLAGLGGLGVVAALYFTGRGPAFGWGSLMAALLVFSGAQMVVLGLIGEYLGRAYLTASRAPQAVVRDVWKKSR
jgi:undecaprenyl-phosphate 4-deoxy-4-formamido-L-arabinose transferase